MKGFLPATVLFSLVGVALAALAVAVLLPALSLVALLSAIMLTLAGGLAVGRAGRLRSASNAPGSAEILSKGQDRFFVTAVLATSAFWLFGGPDVYFRDGGELSGAAVTLGIPHPTGFPVLCMLGKLASLSPIGNVFFRMNLLSGLAAGASAALAWLLVDRVARRSPGEPAAAWWVAPAVYAGSATAWLHAVTPEIYSLSMLGLAALVVLVHEAVRERDARFMVAASALCGIGAGMHVTMPVFGSVVIFAGLVVFAWSGAGGVARLRAFVRVGFICLVAVVAGAFVVLYLPAAASRHPLMNWGDPSNLDRFVDHLTGRRIRDSFGSQIGGANFAQIAANASMAWGTFVESMAPILPLTLAGCIAGAARRQFAVAILVGLVAADFAFAILINPMGIRDLQVLLTATWATAVLAGIGAAESLRYMRNRAGLPGLAVTGGIVILLVLFQWWSSPADRDVSGMHGPKEITDRALWEPAWGATLLTQSDDMSSSLLGRSAAEDARPDMAILVKQQLADTPFVLRRIDPYGIAIRDSKRTAVMAGIEARPFESGGEGIAESVARAVGVFGQLGEVRFEPGEGMADSAVRSSLIPAFPMYRVGATDGGGAGKPAADAWRQAYGQRHGLDRWGKAWLAEYMRLLGTSEAMSGRDRQGIAMLRSAIEMDPGDFRSYHNLAVLVSDAGNPGAAVDLLVACVSINPGYVHGWETLSETAMKAGRTALAAEASERARELRGGL